MEIQSRECWPRAKVAKKEKEEEKRDCGAFQEQLEMYENG